MLVLIKGAGDLATGVALRLHKAHIKVCMTELAAPSSIRRTVCFSEAVYNGSATVEGVTARKAEDPHHALQILSQRQIPVLVDEACSCKDILCPDAVVDAILAKKNLGTTINDAPIVVALGPGFTAGVDCHAVVETMRGHDLGRVLYKGSAMPNTGVPGVIGGESHKRILRAPASGIFESVCAIGDRVTVGQTVATVGGVPMVSQLEGILRGLLPKGYYATEGLKSGDVDPRCEKSNCYSVSDKSRAIGGGVLEAVLHLKGAFHE